MHATVTGWPYVQWAQFSNGGQHDAHELLRFVMSVLHEVHDRITEKPPYVELEDVPEEAPADKADRLWSLLHDREASALSDLFQGQLESRLTCSKCSSTFYTYEPFMDLSLSLFKEGATRLALPALRFITRCRLLLYLEIATA